MGERNSPPRNGKPDLNDMFVAGLELRDAVVLEREIAARPGSTLLSETYRLRACGLG